MDSGIYQIRNKVNGKRVSFCKRGHEMTPENSYFFKSTYRECRACKAIRAQEARLLKKGSV